MQIQTGVPLSNYSTMRLGGPARYVATISSRDEIEQAVAWAEERSLPVFVLGGGSNMVIRDEGYPGLVILNKITGFTDAPAGDNKVMLRIGAGENWDDTVRRTVDMGLTGIEALSLIPGTVGATPVQNVGAYGQEIADTFVELEAYDLVTKGFVRLSKDECQFSYRNSIFKPMQNRRYIISEITLRLTKGNPSPPFYESLNRYLSEHNIDENTVTPQIIRDAVIAVRQSKLPDVAKIANNGSFFKNPIVPKSHYDQLLATYPAMPSYSVDEDRVKVPAGWLIEQAGLKGHKAYGFKTYEQNALVIVNESATSYEQLEAFKQDITATVQQKFGIQLEQEPELL